MYKKLCFKEDKYLIYNCFFKCSSNVRYFIKDINPGCTKKIFLPNTEKLKLLNLKNQKRMTDSLSHAPRLNKFNIQMLSESIYQQVFKGLDKNQHDEVELITHCQETLKKHGMIRTSDTPTLADVNFKIPPFIGNDIIEHFYNIGEEQAKPYRDLVFNLLQNMPKMPMNWIMQKGWTRYAPNRRPEPVDYPLEDSYVLDIEVCLSAGKAPTLATAVSSKAWYGWVSQSVIEETCKLVTVHQYAQEQLISLESTEKDRGIKLNDRFSRPKIVVGHNVSYDRARIKEQYWLESTGMKFLDTMSLHISIAGLTSYQRALLKSKNENTEDEAWKNCGSLNSLSEVHKLYCGTEIEKESRNIFIKGSLKDVNQDFQKLMNYCGEDVKATYRVLKHLFPIFLQRFPHPVTLAGMLELSTAYLPVNSNWDKYINNSEQAYEDLDLERNCMLVRRAEQACQLMHNENYKENLWMWDQDWEVKNLKLRKKPSSASQQSNIKEKNHIDDDGELDPLQQKFQYLEDTSNLLPSIKTLLPGYPNWFRKLCTKPDSSENWVPGPHLISSAMQITPKLLGLTWEGYPLHFIRGKGWGLLVPFSENTDMKTNIPLKQLLEKCPVYADKSIPLSEIDIRIDKQIESNLSKNEYYYRLKKDNTEGIYKGQ